MGSNTRARGRIGTLAVAALTFAGLVAAAPASADDGPTAHYLEWGFKKSFRDYVGGRMNTEPVGQRIVPQAPAQFDGAGDETLPYRFPIAASVVMGAEGLAVLTAGGVTYNFPSHGFTISISDVAFVAEGDGARLLADLDIVVTESFNEFEAGEYHEDGVDIAEVATFDVAESAGVITVTGSGVTLTSAGAAYLPYDEGAPLDDFTVTAPDAAVSWFPQLAVSKTTGLDPESSETVTVNGWGFDPEANVNTAGRPPVDASQPSGLYVVFGKFAADWHPSGGNGDRTVISQRWAIPEPSKTQVASDYPRLAGQLVTLNVDGSFTAELDVTPDDSVAGNYGVYTYAAGGAVANPLHELAVPMSFADPAPVDPSVDAPAVATAPQDVAIAAGSTAKFTAVVTGADSLQWQSRTGNGSWTDIAGATVQTLEVATTSVAQSGTQYRVVATNSGGSVESAPATLTVTKAEATVAVAVKKKARFASKPKATVTVDAPEGVAATGAVVVKAGSKVVGKGTLRDGAATVTLTKKLRPGTRNLVAEYAGNADLTAATSNAAKVKVKKAAAKVKAKLAKKKVKVGKRGVLRVKVTAKGVKPSGKVKVTITKGKKKVRVVTLKAKGGKYAKVRLPKLAAGKYKIQVKYTGSKTVATKSAKKVTLRVR